MDRFESDNDVTFYTGSPNRIVFLKAFKNFGPRKQGRKHKHWHSDDSATVNNQRCDEDAPKQGRPRQLNAKEEFFF